MKPRFSHQASPFFISTLGALAAISFVASAGRLSAETLYWDGSGTSWNAVTSWSTDGALTVPDPAAVPTAVNSVKFNITGLNTPQTVNLEGPQSALGLTSGSTGVVTLQGGGAAQTLTLGAGGLTTETGAGGVVIGSATVAEQRVSVLLADNQTWTNNGSAGVTVANTLSNAGELAPFTLTLGGSAFFNVNGVVSDGGAAGTLGTTALVFDATGACNIGSATASTYSGGTTVKRGTLLVNSGAVNPFGAAASPLTLGDAVGTRDALLRARTFANPIVLATGTTGKLTIDTVGSSSATISGGVTGTNNLRVMATNAGVLTFSTAPVNPTGTITSVSVYSGTGASNGVINLNSIIGANVTGVIVNNPNAAAKLVLGNSGNLYTGDTTVTSGILQLGVTNAIPDGVGKGGLVVNGTLDMNSKNDTVNGLTGTGIVNNGIAGTGTLSVGANDTTCTFDGTLKNTTGTLALTKVGAGTLTLTGANTHTGLTTIAANGGTLLVTNPAALGTGGIKISKIGSQTGTLALQLTGTNVITNTFSTFASSSTLGGAGTPCIRNVSGNNKITSNLTVEATGGNGITVQSDAGAGNLLELSGTISSMIAGGFRMMNVGGTGNGVISGTVINGTGIAAFGFRKEGTGTWTLSGANTYTGNTEVYGGTLQIGDGATSGAISTGPVVNNATVVFNRSDDVTLASAVSGTGKLVKQGAGNLTLAGALSYTGDTTVDAGTLSLPNATLANGADVRLTTGSVLHLTFEGEDTVDELYINGVRQAPGVWGASGSGVANPSTLITGGGRLKVLNGASDAGYDAWTTFHNLTGENASRSADPDHDGRNNLLEFALDGNPKSAVDPVRMRSAIATVDTKKVLTLTLAVRADAGFSGPGDLVSASVNGFTYKIQGSPDCSDFLTATVIELPDALSAGLPEPSLGWEYRTFYLDGAIDSHPRGFLRAIVTEAP